MVTILLLVYQYAKARLFNASPQIVLNYSQVDQVDHINNVVYLFENRYFEFNCVSSSSDKFLIAKDKKVNFIKIQL